MFEVYVMNLGTYKGDYFKIDNLKQLWEARRIISNGVNDVEIQLINCYFNCYCTDFIVSEFLEIHEKYNINPEELSMLFACFTPSEVWEILEKEITYYFYDEDCKAEALRDYITDAGILEIPEHLESYIDWEAVLRDYEAEGWTIQRVGEGQGKYLSRYLIMDSCY